MTQTIFKHVIESTKLVSFIFIIDLKTQLTFLNILYNKQYQVVLLSSKITAFPSFFSLYILSKKNNILKTSLINIKNKLSFFNLKYQLRIEFIGTGYKFFYKNKLLYFILGYSHLIKLKLPTTCEISISNNGKLLILTHSNKYILGNIFYIIKSCRKLNVYKGKGIKNIFDQVKLKLGKTKSLKK